MMRTKLLVPVVALTSLVLAACSSPSSPAQSHPAHAVVAPPAPTVAPAPRDALLIGTGAGVTAIDPTTGAVLYQGSGLLSPGDPKDLVGAAVRGPVTVLTMRDPATGASTATTSIRGRLAIRVVAGDGSRVALMSPLSRGADPWIPTPRATTDIVVADPTGAEPPQRFHIEGNVEPEAFSADGTGLFVIRYLPALAPAAYRVARLELDEGDLYPVPGRNKAWVSTMKGTRLRQVASADGTGLYTLYTSQPASYAAGHDPVQARAKRSVAFVHSLMLGDGFAICVGLPRSLWGGDPNAEAIAVSLAGDGVYVVDVERGVVAEIDTGRLEVVRSVRIAREILGPAGSAAVAAVSPDGSSLFVARGPRMVVIDTQTLVARDVRPTGGDVAAMGFSLDGRSMYLVMPGRVATVDVATGQVRGSIPTPSIRGVRSVATVAV
jgi:DNA-binding beta-propeller fold protein YncE